MKQEEVKKVFNRRDSTVAWFKLAELVSRGEKEKALTLYRLLSHSFEERAYALQLEGDLLWSFGDTSAVDRYKSAAALYKKDQKVASAIAIYEHLLMLQPKKHEHLATLVTLYSSLKWSEKFKESFDLLLDLLENHEVSQELVQQVIEDVIQAFSDEHLSGDPVEDAKGHAHKTSDSFNSLQALLKRRAPILAEKVGMLYPRNLQKKRPQVEE